MSQLIADSKMFKPFTKDCIMNDYEIPYIYSEINFEGSNESHIYPITFYLLNDPDVSTTNC